MVKLCCLTAIKLPAFQPSTDTLTSCATLSIKTFWPIKRVSHRRSRLPQSTHRPTFHFVSDFSPTLVTDTFEIEGDIFLFIFFAFDRAKKIPPLTSKPGDSAGRLVICSPLTLLPSGGNFRFVPDLKRRQQWKESNYYLPATAAQSDPPGRAWMGGGAGFR